MQRYAPPIFSTVDSLACFESETEICDHEEEERIQKGTWTTFELELALEQGYVITRVIGVLFVYLLLK